MIDYFISEFSNKTKENYFDIMSINLLFFFSKNFNSVRIRRHMTKKYKFCFSFSPLFYFHFFLVKNLTDFKRKIENFEKMKLILFCCIHKCKKKPHTHTRFSVS